MKKVVGLGGVFFKCEDPKKQKEWYAKHLGIEGHGFEWRDKDDTSVERMTVFAPFKKETDYFSPSQKDYMFNYIVEDLAGLIEQLKQEGVEVVGEILEESYGKFGWIMDPEGNKIELWEPK